MSLPNGAIPISICLHRVGDLHGWFKLPVAPKYDISCERLTNEVLRVHAGFMLFVGLCPFVVVYQLQILMILLALKYGMSLLFYKMRFGATRCSKR